MWPAFFPELGYPLSDVEQTVADEQAAPEDTPDGTRQGLRGRVLNRVPGQTHLPGPTPLPLSPAARRPEGLAILRSELRLTTRLFAARATITNTAGITARTALAMSATPFGSPA